MVLLFGWGSVVRTGKFYSLSKFQFYNIVLANCNHLVTIRSFNLIFSYTWKFVSFDQILPISLISQPLTITSTLFMSFTFLLSFLRKLIFNLPVCHLCFFRPVVSKRNVFAPSQDKLFYSILAYLIR